MKKLGTIILWGLLGAATPLLLQAQPAETYTFTTNRLVPDGNPSGLSDVRTLDSAIGNITSLTVHLNITGEFNGDLYGYLRHSSGFTVLLNRPGKTASNPAGYPDSGFNVTFQTGAGNGDIHLYQNVTTPAPGSPLTGTWQPDERNVDPTNVTDASPRTTSLTNFNGLNAAGDWTLFLADLQSGGSNELTEWSLTIAGTAYPTLTWPNPADIVYGTALGASQLNATATYNSTNVPGTFTYTPAAGTLLQAGLGQTLSVTFTPTDTNTFLPISTNVTINVTAAPLTITAKAQSKTYGQTLNLGTTAFTTTVLSNSDTVTSVTLNSAGAAAGATVAGSPYTITPSAPVGTGLANYNIAYQTGNLTVNPAPLTITASAQSKTYGQTLNLGTTAFTTTVLSNSDTVTSVTLTSAGAAAGATVAGSPYTITPSAPVGTGLANYSIAYQTGNLTVNPAPLTITASAQSKTYGQTLNLGTTAFTTTVLSNSDTVTSVTLTSAGAAAGATVAGSPYTITPSAPVGTGLANYSIAYQTGNLTVNPAPLTITANAQSKTYGQTLNLGTTAFTTTVLSNSDTVTSVTLTSAGAAAGATVAGSPYTITPSAPVGTGLANYSIAYVASLLTIAQSATTGAMVSSANPALPGANVTFTMTVSPVPPGAGTPGGTVNFRIDGTIAGPGALSGGAATFATSSLTHGSHTVVAEYAGDPNFVGITNSLAPPQIINTPPVAGNLTIERYPTMGVKVSKAAILATDSDADGDALTITVSSASANDAAITVTNGWVFYTPPQGFTNADSFTYTVSDGYGGSATGTITVAIEVDNSPGANLTITNLGNGSFLINGNGIPDRTYTLQFSPSLNPANWQNIPGGSVTADSTGAFQYTDTPAGGGGFYRTVYP